MLYSGGGISDYADNPSEAGPSLVACLNQAEKKLDKDDHEKTPEYLGATAGMRMVK